MTTLQTIKIQECSVYVLCKNLVQLFPPFSPIFENKTMHLSVIYTLTILDTA